MIRPVALMLQQIDSIAQRAHDIAGFLSWVAEVITSRAMLQQQRAHSFVGSFGA